MAKVNRLWNYLMPFATDSTGVCSLLCDSDSIVIGMDPGATAVRCYPFTEKRNDRKARYKGMQVGEMDAVMGKLDESLDRLRLLTEGEHPEYVALVGTPVASLVGVDLKALARRFEKESGKAALGFSTTGNRYYDEGLSDAFRLLYERFRRENPQSFSVGPADASLTEEAAPDDPPGRSHSNDSEQLKNISLLGLNTLDYPEETERKKLLEHLDKHQLQAVSTWGMKSSAENWRRLSNAELHVVCSASGYRLAKRLRKDTGKPFLVLDELLEKTGGLGILSPELAIPEGTQRILIIGEQVTSNVLRKRIRASIAACGKKAPELINAGFFLMHSELMEPQDIVLKSEESLQQVLAEGGHDFIIGDPMYRLLADPSVRFLSRIHPPVSGSFAGQFAV